MSLLSNIFVVLVGNVLDVGTSKRGAGTHGWRARKYSLSCFFACRKRGVLNERKTTRPPACVCLHRLASSRICK